MPAKKKRNNKPKSAKTKSQNQAPTITIHHSSTTFQHREKEETHLRAPSMEDNSPKGNADEADRDIVDVESVKTLEIADDETEPVTETKRDISILEDIIDKAERIIDGDDQDGSSSSSSSSSDDEKEDKVEPSSADDPPVSTVETELIIANVAEDEAVSSPSPVIDQKSDEVEGSTLVVDEAPIESLDTSHQITPNIPSDEPAVTKDSLQPTSWNSCCGLFELLRR